VTVVELPLDHPVAAGLEQNMMRFIAELYPARPPRGGLDAADFVRPHGVFLVAYVAGDPVGCGGVRPLRDVAGVGEVKRVWVEPSHRGHGVSRLLLSALEERARELGYGRLWLDTGPLQREAAGLYETSGYHRIPNYGPEAGTTFKMSFEKLLAGGA
jgi:GNAT superfamily N-acetyltransferase